MPRCRSPSYSCTSPLQPAPTENDSLNDQPADLGHHTFRSGLAALGVRVAQAILSLIAAIVLARLLTPEDFGVVAMVVPFVILTNSMANQGFQTTLIQAPDLTRAQASAFFRFALRANLILVAGFIAASFALRWFYDEARVVPLAAVWGALIWLVTLTAFQEAMLKREMRFPTVYAIHFVSLAAGIASAIVAARLGAGYWAILVQAVMVEVVRAAAVYTISPWTPRHAPALGESVTSLRSFWWSLAGFRFASWVSEQPDRLLVGRLGGAQTLGVYDTAHRWSAYAFTEPFITLSDIAVASLSRVRHDAAQYRLFFAREARAILTLGLPVITFMAVEPASTIRVLLGPQWDGAVPFVRLLCVAAFAGSFTRLTQWVYFSSGATDRLLRWSLLAQTPVLLLSVLLGALAGPRGVAIGYTLATTALAVPSVLWCARGTPITLGTFLRAASRPAAAAIGAGLVLLGASSLLPQGVGASRLLASLAVYVICFVLAWLVAPGGKGAAYELLLAIRELKRRSES
jgi:O-antigen/teichoic acid export membrane protein